jgi:single-strand DNA-binding protein
MLNRITVMGRLTNDPELRSTNNDIPVTSVRLAVQRDFSKDETDFFDVTLWRQNAEFICEYAEKGRMICVDGRLQNRKWEDKHGQNRVTAEIVADHAYFADSRQSGAESPSNRDSAGMRDPFDDDPPFAV